MLDVGVGRIGVGKADEIETTVLLTRLEAMNDKLVWLRSVCLVVSEGMEGYDVVAVVVLGVLPCEVMTETGNVGVGSIGVTDVGFD